MLMRHARRGRERMLRSSRKWNEYVYEFRENDGLCISSACISTQFLSRWRASEEELSPLRPALGSIDENIPDFITSCFVVMEFDFPQVTTILIEGTVIAFHCMGRYALCSR